MQPEHGDICELIELMTRSLTQEPGSSPWFTAMLKASCLSSMKRYSEAYTTEPSALLKMRKIFKALGLPRSGHTALWIDLVRYCSRQQGRQAGDALRHPAEL